ncbi:unnamed protein product, partial [Laminaria digitata]
GCFLFVSLPPLLIVPVYCTRLVTHTFSRGCAGWALAIAIFVVDDQLGLRAAMDHAPLFRFVAVVLLVVLYSCWFGSISSVGRQDMKGFRVVELEGAALWTDNSCLSLGISLVEDRMFSAYNSSTTKYWYA